MTWAASVRVLRAPGEPAGRPDAPALSAPQLATHERAPRACAASVAAVCSTARARGRLVQLRIAGADALHGKAQGDDVLVAAPQLGEHLGIVHRNGRLAGHGVREAHLLPRETAFPDVVQHLQKPDGLALVDHGEDEQALVAVAAHDGHFGRVGMRVAGVHDDGLVILDRLPRHGELGQRVGHGVRPAVAEVIVLREDRDAA